MGWIGTPTKKSLGKHVVRITGVHLAASDSATIGLFGSGKDIELPSGFPTASDDLNLTLSDIISVTYVHNDVGATGNESRHVHVDKSGNTPSTFQILFTNDQNQATSDLEIYVQFFHSIVR